MGSLSAQAWAARITFSYVSNDGNLNLDCPYSETSSNEFHLVCGKGGPHPKPFDVRFSLKQDPLARDPSYQVVFQVRENVEKTKSQLLSAEKTAYSGSVGWMTLSQGTLSRLSFYQNVEKASAVIIVHYNAEL